MSQHDAGNRTLKQCVVVESTECVFCALAKNSCPLSREVLTLFLGGKTTVGKVSDAQIEESRVMLASGYALAGNNKAVGLCAHCADLLARCDKAIKETDRIEKEKKEKGPNHEHRN